MLGVYGMWNVAHEFGVYNANSVLNLLYLSCEFYRWIYA